MPSLYWAIRWDWGVYSIDRDTEAILIKAIRQNVINQQVTPNDIGRSLEGLAVRIRNADTSFSAELERIDPISGFIANDDTEIIIRLAGSSSGEGASQKGVGISSPSIGTELDEFVMWQATFHPSKPDLHYMEVYDSLVGIDKQGILEEMVSLLTPLQHKEHWSLRHYHRPLSIIRTTANKAPVLVFGGDPGTGKTALATSIGAPLARQLGEKVHFRHMSLLMRGMGYQGRASGMIVKAFERIKSEYIQLQEPMILFFDEAESIVGSRRQADISSGSQENIAIVDAIIVGVDSLRKGIEARVVAVFATNLTGHIDVALMRRCYYHRFDRPDERTRRDLLEMSLRGLGFSESELDALVHATRPRVSGEIEVPFTHSDIVEQIIGRAMNAAIRADKPLTLNLLLEQCEKAVPTGFFPN